MYNLVPPPIYIYIYNPRCRIFNGMLLIKNKKLFCQIPKMEANKKPPKINYFSGVLPLLFPFLLFDLKMAILLRENGQLDLTLAIFPRENAHFCFILKLDLEMAIFLGKNAQIWPKHHFY